MNFLNDISTIYLEKIDPKTVSYVYYLNNDYMELRNDETIISSISVTDIFFDVYLGKWNYTAVPKVKTWSYFLTIPNRNKYN